MIKKLFLAGSLLLGFSVSAQADNIASCEVVLMEKIVDEGKNTGAKMASYRPGAEFISSVYDDEDGHVSEIGDHKIRGVMCERRGVIPTLRDFPIVATGIPLSLSQNFDSTKSSLMTLYFKEGEFRHIYKGKPLSPSEQSKLTDVMEIYNLQPHNLGKEDADENATDEKKADKE